MRVEHELGAARVGLRILEQADQLRNQGRVETGVEFVREQDSAVSDLSRQLSGIRSATSLCSLAIAWSNVASREPRARASGAR